ncbi:hypothetical protein [Natronolimnobius baerhuensis]|uniref:DUF5658 domain-containing protein n=1 Tax=Natronolimnobius baerhuensis TaxID=253108 RepID=A0A202EBY4_9EURY|nr:hypothetical protein [Natronolimnobius baerhuensis]OVE85766.1 hypothetical protein B2G88_02825 [Natronolimnobius baerhuensis]
MLVSSPLAVVLWALAIGFYGVGDLVTTLRGLEYDDLEEGQQIPRTILGEPPSAVRFGLFKAVILGVFYAGSLAVPDPRIRLLIPAGIAMVGAYAVFNNLRAIWSVR